ncbi:MAG: outer membrane lipoprotein-sorting protein [bacterium]
MKFRFMVCGLGSVVAALGAAAQTNSAPVAAVAPTAAVAELPSVETLMSNLLARLPAKPIRLSGDLLTAPEVGEKSRLTISIQLRYPREATYTIGDAFGKPLEQLTVLRDNGRVSFLYLTGDPMRGAPAPSLDQVIQNTGLSWMDLTLGFLWWNGGQIIGQEENRGQPCYVLDRHAPIGGMAPYASVRIWVDKRVSMLLQAHGYDKLANLTRRMSVKSFKKINHDWMIKDLEVEDLSRQITTILRIRDAVAAGEPAP